MEQKNTEYDFLFELLNKLEGACDEAEILSLSKDVCAKFCLNSDIKLNDIKIFVFDKTSQSLRDYTRLWQDISLDKDSEKIIADYNFFKNNKKDDLSTFPRLIINDVKLLSAQNLNDFNKEFKKNLILDSNNFLTLPLMQQNKLFGVLRLNFGLNILDIKLQKHFLQLLYFLTLLLLS